MQYLRLKKEKWFHSNYFLQQNNETVGEFRSETLRNGFSLNIKGIEYKIRKGNIWRNEKFLTQGNVQYGQIIEKPFKDKHIIALASGNEFVIKHNIWRNSSTIYDGDKALGEVKSKSFTYEITAAEELSQQVLAALILVTMIRQNAFIIFAALLPLFITLFT